MGENIGINYKNSQTYLKISAREEFITKEFISRACQTEEYLMIERVQEMFWEESDILLALQFWRMYESIKNDLNYPSGCLASSCQNSNERYSRIYSNLLIFFAVL